jgi:hypothetical protein
MRVAQADWVALNARTAGSSPPKSERFQSRTGKVRMGINQTGVMVFRYIDRFTVCCRGDPYQGPPTMNTTSG